MAKKFNKIQRKSNSNYKFIIAIVVTGILLVVGSLISNTISEVAVETFSGGGSTSDAKSFQPSDSQKDMPGRLMWGRDF